MTGRTTAAAAALALAAALGSHGASARSPGHGGGAERFHEEPPVLATLQVERLEHRWRDGENSVDWEADAWVGGDVHKLWLKAEGGKPVEGGVEEAEFQALYGRMVSEFWDVQAGVRHDVRPRPQRTYAVLGLQGVAPYFLDVEAQAFLGEDGDLSARVEVETDLLVTQRLVLQPAAELGLSARRVPEVHLGRGLTELELGLRLRYEFAREFAPYVGVAWERKLGETAGIARRHGEDPDDLSFVTGVRFWF
jgi:copper resistance protein B